MQCVHQSLNGTCVAVLFFLLCRFVSGPCPHTPVWRRQFFFAVNSLSSFILTFRRVRLQLHSISVSSISSNFFVSCSFTSTQWCRPCKLVESGLTTCCPCQLKGGPVSSRQIHMSIVYTPFVHVQLDHRPVSNISNVQILVIQHDSVSSSNNFLH